MYVIGAVINTSVPGVNDAFEKKDAKRILGWARDMVEHGAGMLAINCGDRLSTEPDDIEWVFQVIQKELQIPLCIDSPNAEAHRAGLRVHNNDFGRPMVDSITLEQDRIKAIMPLVREHNALLTAILHDERGMPTCPEDRLSVMPKMEEVVEEYGIARGDVYLDNMVFPLSVSSEHAKTYLESMKLVKQHYPAYKAICGLNNISYGLPREDLLDAAFVTACAVWGQEAVFIELSGATAAFLKTVHCLTGEDDYCMAYLRAYRSGALDVFTSEAVKPI